MADPPAPQPIPDPPESDEPLGPGVSVPRARLQFTFARGSGPGGQSVNKVSTAAQLRVPVTAITGLNERARRRLRRLAGQRLTKADDLLIHARAHRTQLGNRRACLQRLRDLVNEAAREPIPRKARKPSRAMILRRLEAKRQQSEKKRRRRERFE